MGIKALATAVALGVFALAGAAHAEDKGTIGISMPTKSSARWIADGDNMVKSLQAKGYKTDLQYADNDIPTQLSAGREHDHQEGKGAGDRGHRRHDAVGRAAKGRRRRHQGDLLRSPHRRLAERRLLRDLRQFPGRRRAGQNAPPRPRHRRRQDRSVQHRTVRRLRRRQQRLLLLQRRDERACSR